jgi:hypothetical protein
MARVNRAGSSFDMGDDLLGCDGCGAVVAVSQFLEGRKCGLADRHQRCASALANGVVAVGHLVAEDLDPGVDGRVGLLGRFLLGLGFLGRFFLGWRLVVLIIAGGLSDRRAKDQQRY